jgi:single-stranded-DNA-specific exonuclease
MSLLTKRWQIAPTISPEADQALSDYHPLLRQLLYNRKIGNAEQAKLYLSAALPAGIDPFGILGVGLSVERIYSAIHNKEPIAVYGDYDADGVTATALLVQVLQAVGADVRGYIPNRFDEGYGLNKEALTNLWQDGVRLVITVDCGVRSIPEAEHACRLGLDMIITDHHHPAEELPPVLALVNPKQPGDMYPEKNLAGVGLAYKLAKALVSYLQKVNGAAEKVNVEDYLDLVALGTVADLAPLTGENRALVRAGLQRIRKPKRQGLLSLINVAGINPEKINSWEIGFTLGPRLNAAGRLDSALAAYTLLCTQDLNEAGRLAQLLDNQNRERQQITREIQEIAEHIALEKDPNALLLFAADPGFNPGVVGLAASRLTERYYRPAIIAYQGDEFTRASCRSISEFHITDALDACADLLEHHGGHAAAAGFTVRNERLPELLERLQHIAHEKLSRLDLQPVLRADAEVPLVELRPELLKIIDWLQPTGMDNPQAFFVSRNLRVVRYRTVGRDNTHLKLTVTDGHVYFDAIAFQQGYWQAAWQAAPPPKVDLLYSFEENEYNGQISLQLNVKDIKPSGAT